MGCPYVGGNDVNVANGLYDALCTLFVFPAVVYLGACGTTTDAFSGGLCEFLGRLSYPVYILHYPVMYLFYSWVWNNGYAFSQVWPVCAGLFLLILLMAWCALKFYDEPVRKYLSHRFLSQKS